VHETADEEVIHPFTRRGGPGGEKVVEERLHEERLHEEREAKELLSRLDGVDTDDPNFLPELQVLRLDVMRHARAEERYEFNHIRRHADKARLASMATALHAAEAMAPTHPHPGTESAAKNLTLGPLSAHVDRTRDAVRNKAMGKDG
jgi:hypothetical protein